MIWGQLVNLLQNIKGKLQMDSRFKCEKFNHESSRSNGAGCLWLTPVILAAWKVEVSRITVVGQLDKKVCDTPSQPKYLK
jgi:hypothetical protein